MDVHGNQGSTVGSGYLTGDALIEASLSSHIFSVVLGHGKYSHSSKSPHGLCLHESEQFLPT